MELSYFIVDDIDVALANDYIGEFPVYPKMLDSIIHMMFTGEPLGSWVNIYCGKPDQRLKDLFGYR